MIQPYALRLTDHPQVSIICGVTPNREYLRARCMAEMANDLRGLPVEFVWCELTDEEWNECKCKNTGAKCATSNAFVFTNCDITIPKGLIDCVLVASPAFSWLQSAYRYDEQPDGSLIENPHALGDFQAVSRPAFVKAGGFDERMTGWGYLDYDFAERCRKTGASYNVQTEVRVTHHWHPRLTDEEYRAMNLRNREIAECPK